MASNPQQPSTRDTILGMVIVAVSTALLVAAGAAVQWSSGSVLQVMLGSYIIQNMISIAWWKTAKPPSVVNWWGDSPNRLNIWVRGLLYFIEFFCWFKGLELVPIGDAEALIFLSPLLTVFLARLLLKETLPKLYIITTILTLIGLFFISQPTFIFKYFSNEIETSYEQINLIGIGFLIGMALSWSFASLLVRTAPGAHWLQLNYVSSFQAAYIWVPILIIINHIIWLNGIKNGEISGKGNGTPSSNLSHYSVYNLIDANDINDWDFSWKTILAMFITAFCEYFAMVGKIVGYQLGEATKVAWMEYFDIIFAYIAQAWIFNRIPNVWEIVGGIILIITCTISFLEEKCYPREDINDKTSYKNNRINNKLIEYEEQTSDSMNEASELISRCNSETDGANVLMSNSSVISIRTFHSESEARTSDISKCGGISNNINTTADNENIITDELKSLLTKRNKNDLKYTGNINNHNRNKKYNKSKHEHQYAYADELDLYSNGYGSVNLP